MIEIHILTTRPHTVQFAIDSSPVIPRVISGMTIMKGREFAYNDGDSEKVSFIDDDDTSLLTKQKLFSLCDIATPALFTNSNRLVRRQTIPLNNPWIRTWSWELEKQKMITPHQTMIIDRKLAIDITKLAITEITEHQWDPGIFDYVFRVLISKNIGWYYVNDVTYNWNVGVDSFTTNGQMKFIAARRHFFGDFK